LFSGSEASGDSILTNDYFMSALRRLTNNRIGLPAPTSLLKLGALLIGTEAELVLKSRWVKQAAGLNCIYYMPSQKKTLVLGASDNPSRYSYLAINRLRGKGHPVVAIGQRRSKVGDVEIGTEKNAITDIDTVTLYLNSLRQKEYYDFILSLHPKRIIFNPGAENPELAKLAQSRGIQPLEACTLVLLSTGQF
jgi:predicted CoA-binding protein